MEPDNRDSPSQHSGLYASKTLRYFWARMCIDWCRRNFVDQGSASKQSVLACHVAPGLSSTRSAFMRRCTVQALSRGS
jgi:hypothetical protein